ncbi:MAG: Fic family protein [Dehalococcoidia bacterium]|nr:Fic family protein [Dehalococcoidia bacterium]
MTVTLYHLGKFPPKNLDWARLVPAIGRAHSAVAAYGAMLESIPNTNVLISPLATQEAVYSNRIEGTQTTLTQVLTFQADEDHPVDDPVKRQDAYEVVNYRKALDSATRQMEQIPLSLRLIRDAHRILMSGVRGQDKTPGEYRRIPNSVWIGPPGSTIETADFVPCPVDYLSDAMDVWEKFIHSDEPDPLVQLAIVHAEFESIHPFLDGNGRLGRLIVPLFMVSKGLLEAPHFYISGYLDLHRDEYYSRLLMVSRDDDWTGWSEFFLSAVAEQANNNLRKARSILSLYDDLKEWMVDETRSQYSVRALDWIFAKPIFRSSDFVRNSGIPVATASRILKILRDSEMLVVLTEARGRRPALLALGMLLSLAEVTE